MSGETERDVSGWTVDTLGAHILRLLTEHDRRYEQRFKAQEEATKAALSAAQKAADILEVNTQRWRDASNEWRATLTDRERQYLPRSEAAVLEKQNAERISLLITRLDTIEDRINSREDQGRGLSKAWGYVVGVVGLVSAAVAFIVGTR